MRRSMLREFAPIMTLNDWADADHVGEERPIPTEPLPGMHPATARGIVALRERGLPHATVLSFVWDWNRIRSTARLGDQHHI